MNVSTFYKQSHCQKVSGIERLVFEENKYTVLEKANSMICSLLKEGESIDKILKEVQTYLESHYQTDWWPFSWQRENHIKQDIARYQRFLHWLGKPDKVVDCDVTCKFQGTSDGNYLELSQDVSMICKRGEQYYAYLLNSGMAKRSMKGRSVHTSVLTDLEIMIPKLKLERKYPGITICQVFLRHKDDSPESIRPNFEVSQAKTSNVFVTDFGGFVLEDESFDFKGFSEQIQTVIDTPFAHSCYDCSYHTLCKLPSLESSAIVKEPEPVESHGYVMPSFTPSQLEVVNHKAGPLRVCAGPGSGKTAVLIGRIKKLIDGGVPSEFILAVTFSNEAAEELRKRCLSFCEEAYLPHICTLNAFGYRVLLDNKDLLDREINLLTNTERNAIIKNLLSLFPPLMGVNYNKEYGRGGLYQTIAGKLDTYFACESDAEFFQKVPTYGTDFVRFAHQYKDVIEARDFITFDEQIILCNKLFEEHPDILSIYQQVYKYICVDEYQDVNRAQVDMIYHLASHRNLMVVGDDDQSIYGFRGASASYMIDFVNHFPEAKTVVLKENFRSSKAIVDAAQAVISNNKARIDKDVRSTRELANARLPILVNGMDAAVVERVIAEVIHDGYSYGDIAVLSTKNAPLENLMQGMKSPCVLAKSYLRLEPLFLFLHGALATFYNPKDDTAMYILTGLFKLHHLIDRAGGCIYDTLIIKGYPSFENAVMSENPINQMLYKVGEVHRLFRDDLAPDVLLKMVAYNMNLEESPALPILLDQFEKQHIDSLEKMYKYTSRILQYEDETRVDVVSGNRVTLITSHDSKGREFPVVIMLNDYAEDASEDVRRLFYVAMTRPKDRLYVLSEKPNKVLSEMPHEIWKEVS